MVKNNKSYWDNLRKLFILRVSMPVIRFSHATQFYYCPACSLAREGNRGYIMVSIVNRDKSGPLGAIPKVYRRGRRTDMEV